MGVKHRYFDKPLLAGRIALGILLFSPFTGGSARADAVSDMASFSNIQGVDLAKLAADAVPLSGRGAPMKFARGLAVQSCYVLPLPLQKAVEFQKRWKPSRHPELKVYLHREFSAKPTPAEFQFVAEAPDNASVRAFVAATQALSPDHPELQMSVAEAKLAGKSGGGSAAMPPAVASFWGRLLQDRALAFLAGGAARQAPYESAGETIRPADEFSQLLKEQPKIAARFRSLIDEAGLLGGSGKLTPALAAELFDVEGVGALTLGASYGKQAGESWQGIDAQFYATGGYHVMLTCYQCWPVKLPSGDATLVWRGDLLSSASLAELHGVERLGAMGAMTKAIQKSIGFLQKDAAAAAR